MVLLMFVIVFEAYNDNYDSLDSREDYGRPPLHTKRNQYNEGEKDNNSQSIINTKYLLL